MDKDEKFKVLDQANHDIALAVGRVIEACQPDERKTYEAIVKRNILATCLEHMVGSSS